MTKPILSALMWRFSQAIVVAILVGVLTFAMMMALPGDMLFRIAGARFGYDNINIDNVELVRSQIGDPSGVSAFLGWLKDLSTGNLGQSLVTGQSVWGEIVHQLGATAQLAGVALLLSLLIGPPLGIWAGLHPGSWLDRGTLFMAAMFKATPQFLLGLGLIVVVSVGFGLLPAAGYGNAEHFILPALTLAMGLAANTTRITREAVVQAKNSDWWRFARWKGLSERQVLLHHGLRHISVPLITLVAAQFVALMEGVVVVETIFGWPGIGHALVHAVFHRDVPMVQGTALVMGLAFVLVNVMADVTTRILDPRAPSK